MKPRISPELLKKIKDAVNIVDVVGEHVVLRKAGSNFTGLCPFHSERSPSFSVTATKQLYHCYGCKRGGDVVTFLEELHGITFLEAVEELSESASVALPKDWEGQNGKEDPAETARRRAARDKLQTATKLNRFVAAFYHHTAARDAEASRYFVRRGVGAEQTRSFYTGFAPAAWEALALHLTAKKAPLPLAVELGLIRPSTKGGGGGHFDLFRNRAMFPIVDLRGKVVGFGGRTMPTAMQGPPDAPSEERKLSEERRSDGEKTPKYLNSPESFLFHKSKVAFGLFQAQKHIREKRELILVEGYFDVIALHAAGFENVVATCGTSLTPEHLALFRRIADRIIILFDGDKAGVTATERAMEIGLEHGLVLHGAAMPAELDPDQVLFEDETGRPVEGGRERMAAILAAAQPLLDSRIDEAVRAADAGPEARTQAIKRVGGWLSRFRDPVGREVRVQDLQTKLNLPASLLGTLFGVEGAKRQSSSGASARPPQGLAGVARASIRQKPQQSRPAQARPAVWTDAERLLIRALVRGGDLLRCFEEIAERLPPGFNLAELFDHPAAKGWVADQLTEQGGIGRLGTAAALSLEGDVDPQVRSIVTEEAQAQTVPIDGSDLKTLLEKRIGKIWARFSQQIKAAIADAESKQDAGLEKKLKREYLDVQRKMKEFISFYDEAKGP